MRGTMQDCPKCGLTTRFEYKYLPPGIRHRGEDVRMHTGPCVVRTCDTCGYTYNEPPKDGEGNDRTD